MKEITKMKNYGIIAAMQEEMQEIQKIMKNIQKIEIYGCGKFKKSNLNKSQIPKKTKVKVLTW